MNSIGGGDHTPFEELSRWRQVLTLFGGAIMVPLVIGMAVAFIATPFAGAWVAASGEPGAGVAFGLVGVAIWVLSSLLLRL